MPIGPDHKPPGVDPAGKPGFLDRIAFNLGGVIGGAIAVLMGSGSPTVEGIKQAAFKQWPIMAIDPVASADAVQRGVLPGADWAGEALLSGVDRERFDAMVELSGNPPGPAELLARWRLGAIDDAQLDHGIRQGRTKNEWIPFYRGQRHLPISIADAVRAAVQNHLSKEAARAVADGQGVASGDFDVLYETFGRPPSLQEMLSLWRRGLATESEVDQAIRESDLKDKYIAQLKHLADYLPPPRTITTLLSHGAIDTATANDLFRKAGLSAQLAAAYVASAAHVKAASHKELAVGQVTSLYADRIINRAAALADLGKIGYEANEANLVLDLADDRAKQKVRTQAVGRVRTLYVGRKIGADVARSDLTKIGLDPGQVDDLLPLWEIEQSTPTKTLTEAQTVAAFKAGIIAQADLRARLVALGYDQADADILVTMAGPPPSTAGG